MPAAVSPSLSKHGNHGDAEQSRALEEPRECAQIRGRTGSVITPSGAGGGTEACLSRAVRVEVCKPQGSCTRSSVGGCRRGGERRCEKLLNAVVPYSPTKPPAVSK